MALCVGQCHQYACDHRAVNSQSAVPDPEHGAPIQAAVRIPVKVQIEQNIIEPGTDDAARHRPEHHVHNVVLSQAIVFGLLHAEIQPRQHGKCQNDPVPVDPVADMDGHRVNVQFPIPEQAGEADGHVFQCAHNRFFLSAAKSFPRRIYVFCKRPNGPFRLFPKTYCFGTIRLRTIRSAVTLVFRNAATSSGVMDSNTSGKRRGS